MSREVQVRFCESRAVRSRPATHLLALCHAREQALTARASVAADLDPDHPPDLLRQGTALIRRTTTRTADIPLRTGTTASQST